MGDAPCTGVVAVPLLALASVSCSQDGRWDGEGAGVWVLLLQSPPAPCWRCWAEKELFLSITSQCRLSFPFFIPSQWVGELGGSSSLMPSRTQKVLAAWVPFPCGEGFGGAQPLRAWVSQAPQGLDEAEGVGCACRFGVSSITVAFRHTAGFAG